MYFSLSKDLNFECNLSRIDYSLKKEEPENSSIYEMGFRTEANLWFLIKERMLSNGKEQVTISF